MYILLIFMAIGSYFIYNSYSMVFVSKILSSFNLKPAIILTGVFNTFLLVYGYYMNVDIIITYIFAYLALTLELLIFSKAKPIQLIFLSSLFLIHLLILQSFTIIILSLVLEKSFYEIVFDNTYYFVNIIITFLISTVFLFLVQKYIKSADFRMISYRKEYLKMIVLSSNILLVYLFFDLYTISRKVHAYDKFMFLLITYVVYILVFYTTFKIVLKIIRASFYGNKYENLDKDYKLSFDRLSKLKMLAMRDNLTGCFTKQYIMDFLDETLDNREFPFCIAYVDLDKLKFVNDVYGHMEGDKYIKDISKTFFHVLRETDILSRIGGDEFIIIFPNTKENSAELILNRISKNVHYMSMYDNRNYKMSISYGVVEINENSPLSKEKIIKMADDKMYDMKLEGKKKR